MRFYEKFGFRKVGESKCEFGGGGWMDMVRDLQGEDDEDEFEEVEEEVWERVEE